MPSVPDFLLSFKIPHLGIASFASFSSFSSFLSRERGKSGNKFFDKNQGLSWADAGGPARGWAGPGRPARPGPSKKKNDGPRPGPAHQILIWWVAAQPGPSSFQRMGRGPVRTIKLSEDGPSPGPAHHIFKNSRPGLGRPITWRRGP